VTQDGRMRKTVPFVAAWFLAGVAAVALASAGVAAVGRQVTGSRPAPFSADQVREKLAADGVSTTTTTTTDATTTTTAPGTATTTGPGPTPGTGSPGTQTGGATSTTSTPAPPPPPVATPTTRTYNLVGGTATLRFSSTGVEMLAAAPNTGFSVEVSETHSNGVRVEFENDDGHRSRVDAWWDGGPQDEVREDD